MSPSESVTMDADTQVVLKRETSLTDCLNPLLTSMKLFGLYFVRQTQTADTIPGRKWRRCNAWMIHGMIIVALMWINVVRMFSVFKSEDKFGLALLTKTLAIVWTIELAILQTAFYASSHRGTLQDVFSKIKLPDDCARYLRRMAIVYTIVAWLIMAVTAAVYMYGLFFTEGFMNILLTPLDTYVAIESPLVPSIFMYLFVFYLTAAHLFTQATTFLMAMLFKYQFTRLNKALECRLDSQGGRVEDAEFEAIRQEHKKISMSLGNIDGCLMFSNAAAFCGQLACFIILLYMIMFFHVLVTDPVINTIYVYWAVAVMFGLIFTIAGGIIINDSVCILRLHCKSFRLYYSLIFYW